MFKLNLVFEDINSIMKIVPSSLLMAFVILIFGIVLGAILAVIRLYNIPVLNKVVVAYVSFVRGIPLMISLYIVYYSLPEIIKYFSNGSDASIGSSISPVLVVVIAYSLYTASSQSENIRAALASVEPGQFEAAYSIGLTGFQTMVRIVFPQALKVAIPAFFNMYLGIIKGLSLGFMVGIVDIFAQAKLSSALNFGFLESYVAAGVTYWALCGLLTVLFNRLEMKYFKGRTS